MCEIERNNKGIAIKLFIVGLIISFGVCGVGFVEQNDAKKTNEEKTIIVCRYLSN